MSSKYQVVYLLHIISSELNCFVKNKYKVDLNKKSVCNVYILISNCLFLRLSNTKFARIFRPVTFVNFNLLTLSTILLVTFMHVRPLPHCSTVSSEGRCTVESLLMLTEISKSFKLNVLDQISCNTTFGRSGLGGVGTYSYSL